MITIQFKNPQDCEQFVDSAVELFAIVPEIDLINSVVTVSNINGNDKKALKHMAKDFGGKLVATPDPSPIETPENI